MSYSKALNKGGIPFYLKAGIATLLALMVCLHLTAVKGVSIPMVSIDVINFLLLGWMAVMMTFVTRDLFTGIVAPMVKESK